MHVRCPHCSHPIELVEACPLSDINCPSCGSSFSLAGEETVSFRGQAPRQIAHFQFLSLLGSGAFGSVWKARDTELDRLVAVKIPRKGQLDATETEKFLREARSAAQLKHPSIVSIHEVGRDAETVYIVSDFVEGLSLTDWLSIQKPTHREAAELCRQAAEALEHAHQTGIVHRDLKPGNILIDPQGRPHIMDFGLAKREAGEVTMTTDGQVLGTPAYMSPEQAAGEAHNADRRSDVYSLGVILFELLTRERPFRGNVRTLIHQVIHDDPPSPRKLDSRIPRDLETICLKCLEKKPERRYATAAALAGDLNRFLAREPIEARPLGRTARAWRWCQRKPALAAMTGLSAAAAIAVVGVSIAFGIASTQSARRLNVANERARLALDVAQNQAVLAEAERQVAKRAEALAEARKTTAENAERAARAAETLAKSQEGLAIEAKNQADLQAEYAKQREQARLRMFYASEMNLAQRAWEDDDDTYSATSAVTLLNRHRPGDGQPDLRGFEWHYLLQLTSPLRSLQEGLTGNRGAAFSPDGGLLAVASHGVEYRRDEAGQYWPVANITIVNPADGAVVASLEPSGQVSGLAFAADGRSLVAVVEPSQWQSPTSLTIQQWDAATWQIGESIGPIHDAGEWRLSHDGRRLVVSFVEPLLQSVKLWDLEAGGEPREVWRQTPAHALGGAGNAMIVPFAVDLSPGGQKLAIGGVKNDFIESSTTIGALLTGDVDRMKRAAGAVSIVDLVGDAPIVRCEGGFKQISNLRFSNSGTLLAGTGYDTNIALWTVETGKLRGKIAGHGRECHDVAFSPDDRTLATVAGDGTTRIWDLGTFEESRRFKRLSYGEERVALSRDGTMLVVGGSPQARMYDPRKTPGRRTLATLEDRVNSMAFASDGKTLYLGLAAREAGPLAGLFSDPTRGRLEGYSLDSLKKTSSWSVRSGRVLQIAPAGESVAFRSDAAVGGVFGADGSARYSLGGQGEAVDAIAVSPEGAILAVVVHADETPPDSTGNSITVSARVGEGGISVPSVGGPSPAIRLFATATGAAQGAIELTVPASCAAFSRDGTTLYAGDTNGTIRAWNLADRSQVAEFPPPREGLWISSIAASPDGQTLVAGQGVDLAFIDLKAREVRKLETHWGHSTGLQYSPDGKSLAALSANEVKLIDPIEGHERFAFRHKRLAPNAAAFSPDSGTLAIAWGGGTDAPYEFGSEVVLYETAAPVPPSS